MKINPNWELLKCPQPLFKQFKPNEEKLKLIARELMDKKFNLSDEFRSYPAIYRILGYYLSMSFSIFYEIGNMDALVGFVNIYPTFKAEALMKIVRPDFWSKDFVRQSRKVVSIVMDELQLKRLHTETADEKVVKLTELVGFKEDGIKPNDFMWERELFDVHVMSITREK